MNADSCPNCGAFRTGPGIRPRLGRGSSGVPGWLVPLGLLPWFMSAFLAFAAAAGLASLAYLEVESKGAYWLLGVLFFLAVIGLFVRRSIDAARDG